MDKETLRLIITLVREHVEHESDRSTAGLSWPTPEQLQNMLKLVGP